MNWLLLILFPMMAISKVNSEAFIIQVSDHSVKVISPEKQRTLFSVIVENRSLSDQLGKFIVNGSILKFVKIKSGSSETVELENKTNSIVKFVPVNPAFQEVELKFGKKVYEIPPQE